MPLDIIDIIALIINFLLLYFTVFWIHGLWLNKEKILTNPKPKKFPKVSILIPAYNEENYIKRAITSCLNLVYPKNKKEIIVINDGSTDKTREIVEKFSRKGLVKLINKERGGKANALNLGIKQAKGDLISSLDADSFFSKKALMNMVGYFSKGVAAVTPALKVDNPKKLIERFQWLEYLSSILYAKLFSFHNSIYVTPGPGSVYKKSVLKKIGGFDENCLTEDMELAFRLQKYNYKIKNSMRADVYTTAPKSISGLMKQRVRWRCGFLENTVKYKDFFFNPKYKTLGNFLLPISLIVTFSSFLLVYFMIVKPGIDLTQNLIFYSKIGFDISSMIRLPDLNDAYVFFDSMGYLYLFPLIIYFFVVSLSLKYSNEEKNIRKKPFYFMSYLIFFPILTSFFTIIAIFYFLKIKTLKHKNDFKVWD